MHPSSGISFSYFWPLFLVHVVAQDFTIQSTWKDSTSNISRGDRAQVAQDAIGQLIPLIESAGAGSTSGSDASALPISTTASLFAVLALNDWITGETTYKSTIINNIPYYFSFLPNGGVSREQVNSDGLLWGLTAYYTFRAYNDSSFLSNAIKVWDHASQYLITDAQAQTGRQPTRNFTFPPQCNGSSVAGGVFWVPGVSSDGGVNGETVGPFLALSAYLAEATSNSTYTSSAELSAAFIRDHLYNGTLIWDNFDVKGCQVSDADFIFTYDSGFAIEGFSVLGNVTKNDTWTSLVPLTHSQSAHNLVATTGPFWAWTGPDDVINEGDQHSLGDARTGYKRIFIRALHEVWYRNDPNSDIAKFIASFLTVQASGQFNSIRTQAKRPGSNVYSPFWSGPTQSFEPYSQAVALYALNSAISLQVAQPVANGTPSGSTSNSPSPSSSTSSSPSTSSSFSRVGPIVGGVVAALVIVIACVVIVIWRRRSPRRCVSPSHDIDPFITQPLSIFNTSGIRTVITSTSGKRIVDQPTAQTISVDMGTATAPLAVNQEDSGRVETAGGDGPVWMRRIVENVLTQMRSERSPLQDDAPPPQYEG
ncbi:hypothetical protein OF83DRAFT_1174488 [Amylostereum chailletii]|nr:hypothetical protein OF83DRAFT_1174488 [Amylostereum chailletii]